MLLIILGVAGVLVLAVVAVVLVGARLPRDHSVTRSVRLRQHPDAVWALITDVDAYPDWRPGVKSVERLSEVDGAGGWRETRRDGAITFQVRESVPGERLVVRIADTGLPFGGAWTHVVAPADEGGSTLTVTEDGEVYNPVFRFVSRFVIGHTRTIDRYLEAVATRFGETAAIQGR
jgi:uncharacterized protein YndB with AHSA1/START domain